MRVERKAAAVDVHGPLPLVQRRVVDLQDALGPHAAAGVEPRARQHASEPSVINVGYQRACAMGAVNYQVPVVWSKTTTSARPLNGS